MALIERFSERGLSVMICIGGAFLLCVEGRGGGGVDWDSAGLKSLCRG